MKLVSQLLNAFPRTRLLIIRRVYALVSKGVFAVVAHEIDTLACSVLLFSLAIEISLDFSFHFFEFHEQSGSQTLSSRM